MGPTASSWIATVQSLRRFTAGVVTGPGPDVHASSRTMRNARPPTAPVVAQAPRASRSIGTASRRTAARQPSR